MNGINYGWITGAEIEVGLKKGFDIVSAKVEALKIEIAGSYREYEAVADFSSIAPRNVADMHQMYNDSLIIDYTYDGFLAFVAERMSVGDPLNEASITQFADEYFKEVTTSSMEVLSVIRNQVTRFRMKVLTYFSDTERYKTDVYIKNVSDSKFVINLLDCSLLVSEPYEDPDTEGLYRVDFKFSNFENKELALAGLHNLLCNYGRYMYAVVIIDGCPHEVDQKHVINAGSYIITRHLTGRCPAISLRFDDRCKDHIRWLQYCARKHAYFTEMFSTYKTKKVKAAAKEYRAKLKEIGEYVRCFGVSSLVIKLRALCAEIDKKLSAAAL